jgi:hypothetical protein
MPTTQTTLDCKACGDKHKKYQPPRVRFGRLLALAGPGVNERCKTGVLRGTPDLRAFNDF